MTKQKIAFFVISFLLMSVTPVMAQEATAQKAQTEAAAALDTSAIDTTSLLLDEAVAEMDDSTAVADGGAYTQLKKKFNAEMIFSENFWEVRERNFILSRRSDAITDAIYISAKAFMQILIV